MERPFTVKFRQASRPEEWREKTFTSNREFDKWWDHWSYLILEIQDVPEMEAE